MTGFEFKHPELESPWNTVAKSAELATKQFEDCWALRVAEGLLEQVDGGFFDGEVRRLPVPKQPDLCSHSMEGHWWQSDDRPERTEMPATAGRARQEQPVVCILCKKVSWHRRDG